jgi:SAM-dependent methyltransferase
MNAIDIYYKNQATARNLNTIEQVNALAGSIDRIYDALILPELPANKQVSIYEVACGPGLVLAWLGRRGYSNVRGTDICDQYVDLAKGQGLNARVCDSLVDLKNYADGSLDVVFAIDFIEHLPKDILMAFISESSRVLTAKGILILRAPNGDSPFVGRNLYNDITHYWAYTSIASNALLGILGFRFSKFIDEASAPAPRKYLWIWPFSWASRKILYLLVALATKERIKYWGPNLFIIGYK